jgi:hypothetical protein
MTMRFSFFSIGFVVVALAGAAGCSSSQAQSGGGGGDGGELLPQCGSGKVCAQYPPSGASCLPQCEIDAGNGVPSACPAGTGCAYTSGCCEGTACSAVSVQVCCPLDDAGRGNCEL